MIKDKTVSVIIITIFIIVVVRINQVLWPFKQVCPYFIDFLNTAIKDTKIKTM